MLLSVFVLACLVQLVYWCLLHHGFRRAKRDEPAAPVALLPPVSVVVAARNEASALPGLLAALDAQTHPDFEVVFVDDASTDATPQQAKAWIAAHPNGRLVSVEQPRFPRKKQALTRGIHAARHELLALTDADCTPPPGWLAGLARASAAVPEGETVLVGYSPARRAPGWLNRLVRYETLVTAVLTAAAVGLGRAYMAVGRNLGYTRAVFDRVGGFTSSMASLSGDDDLFVQEVVRQRAARIRYLFDPATFVPTDAPSNWRSWIRQKQRHVSAGRYYDRFVQVHLAVFQTSALLLWLAPLVAGWPGLLLLCVRLGAQAVVLYHAAGLYGERDLLVAFPLLELLYAVYNAFIAPVGLLRRGARW